MLNHYATIFDGCFPSSSKKLHAYFNTITFVIFLALCQTSRTEIVGTSSTSTFSASLGQQLSNVNCPTYCTCTYQSSDQNLIISCYTPSSSSSSNEQNDQDTASKSNLIIKKLTITNTVIDSFTISQINKTILQNSISELNLHQNVFDPLHFLSSDVIRLISWDLRKITFTASHSTPFGLPKGLQIQYFSQLRNLEHLIVQDCDPGLGFIILKTLPSVHQLTIVNSSVDYLDKKYFTGQSELRFLNLSHNKIQSIPYGLSQQMPLLRVFDISHNEIEHLQEEVFVGLGELRFLHVNNNKIRYVDTEVFNPLKGVELVDLSKNQIIQIFEPYFQENKNLRVLLMADSWSWDSFVDYYKATRSFTEMERLLATLSAVEILDISDNEMIMLPETLTHAPQLKRVSLHGNPWKCSCDDRWVPDWVRTTNVSIVEHHSLSTIFCQDSNDRTQKYPIASFLQNLKCKNGNITARTPIKYYGIVGRDILLKCHTQRKNSPIITWITPSKRSIYTGLENENIANNDTLLVDSNLIVEEDGDLFISELTTENLGLYLCIASYPDLNITHYVHLGMDTSIFLEVKFFSILVGFLTSFIFLFTVLVVQLVRGLLERCGIDCLTSNLPSSTRRVRAFFESIEQNNTSQLDWLRDNYNMQAKRIKDNCSLQLERIRESYTAQTKNLSDIKYYGAQQLHTIRDQYYDQIRRVSTYSSQHLCKVRENYVFQRNRVSKFSSHQLLRLRETYKWQAQTLNKILENLPKTLNFDTCRGMGRADSLYLDEIGELRPLDVEVIIESGTFECTRPGNSSEKMEHVSLLIPPNQRPAEHFHHRFILPQNIESTELVVVITKPTSQSDISTGSGVINQSVIMEEEEEGDDDDDKDISEGDAKC